MRLHSLLLLAGLGCATLPAAETPDGWIVWSSGRGGGGINTVWIMKADGTGVTQLVKTESDSPKFSPDGTWIAYNAGNDTHLMRPDGSDDKVLAPGMTIAHWFPNGTSIAAVSGDEPVHTLWKVEVPSGKATKIVEVETAFSQLSGIRCAKFSISADLRWITTMTTRFGRQGYTATNGRKKTSGGWAATILDLKNPGDLYYFGDGCQPMLPPWGPMAYHVNNGGGVIAEMQLEDHECKTYRGITARGEVGWGYCPSISTDNQWLVYIGCKTHGKWGSDDYDVYVQPLSKPNDESARTRLAQDPANDRWPHMYVGPLQVGIKQAPSAPKGLAATRAADGLTCALTWQDASTNESGFAIDARTSATGEFVQIMVAPPNSTSFTIDHLDAAAKYGFRVRAVNLAGSSDPSNQAGEIVVAEAPKVAAKEAPAKPAGDTPDKLLAKADADFTAKRYAQAQKGYEAIIAKHPDSPEAATAKTKLDGLKADPAVAKAAGAAERDGNIRKWMSLARTYAGSGDKATAKEYYQKVITTYPDAPQAKEATQAMAALK